MIFNNLKNKKIAIYSAIYGGFDDIKEQPKQSINCDFIMFTDNAKLLEAAKNSTWKIVEDKRQITQDESKLEKYKKTNVNRIIAKYYKCNPHEILADYDYVIWIDGSAQIKNQDFIKTLVKKLGRKELMVFKHPERDNIYDEAEFCKDWPKYKDLDIMGQVQYYKSVGFPDNYGLSAGGMIVRKNKLDSVKKFNEYWWNENLNWTYQDQLSFEYSVWKTEVKLKRLNLNLWDNKLIEFQGHNSKTNKED